MSSVGPFPDLTQPPRISVHDHIIVGKNGHASLKGMRLIFEALWTHREQRWATG